MRSISLLLLCLFLSFNISANVGGLQSQLQEVNFEEDEPKPDEPEMPVYAEKLAASEAKTDVKWYDKTVRQLAIEVRDTPKRELFSKVKAYFTQLKQGFDTFFNSFKSDDTTA